MTGDEQGSWHKIDPSGPDVGRVTTRVIAGRALCITRTEARYGVLDNRCPHQGGPLGEGEIDHGYVLCPWHGYEYDPITGEPPPGFADAATSYPIEQRPDGLYVQLPVLSDEPTLMDQMVDVMTEWGVDSVFGMVGHSNLGLADALRKADEDGRLRYFGIRHEGAAAFAASGYAKLTGRAGCLFLDRRPRCHQPSHRPLGRQGRSSSDSGADRTGSNPSARPWSLSGGPAQRSICGCRRVEPNGACATKRDGVDCAGAETRHRQS